MGGDLYLFVTEWSSNKGQIVCTYLKPTGLHKLVPHDIFADQLFEKE